MINVQKLTKYYGERAAISDISFDVHTGEILGFLGPNGAGKTTTMRILAGFMPADKGTAKVAGFDVMTQSLEARRNVGYLPEMVPLYPDITVADYLDFMARLRGVSGKRKAARTAEVMEVCHIRDVADKHIGKLSKGYKQRVGLAQALIHDPKVLILDEPTTGLDPKQINETRQTIKRLGGDHTVILSTHILPEVSMTCNRVVIISEGKVAAVDTPENLTRRLTGSERIEMEIRGQKGSVTNCLRAVDGVVGVEINEQNGRQRYLVECKSGVDIRAQLAAAVVRGNFELLQLNTVGMSLEEIFLKLTTKEDVAA
ncbi:MAG: ABC transporter ATP-binding protein [Chloroflexi bacterium]|nr:ABC transporter ATP-binding protein [Chloroflexota bacterium]